MRSLGAKRMFVLTISAITISTAVIAESSQGSGLLARAAGELFGRYLTAGNSCHIELPYLTESVPTMAFFKENATAEWEAGWIVGESQFKKEFDFSPRMACITFNTYLRQDAESVAGFIRAYDDGRRHK
jgi:hypothetical protein